MNLALSNCIYRSGKSNGDVDSVAAIQPELARYKHPKRIFFRDALPRNAMGKVEKAALRKDFADTFKVTLR